MKVIHERCCGLDVHKETVVACLIVPKGKAMRTLLLQHRLFFISPAPQRQL